MVEKLHLYLFLYPSRSLLYSSLIFCIVASLLDNLKDNSLVRFKNIGNLHIKQYFFITGLYLQKESRRIKLREVSLVGKKTV